MQVIEYLIVAVLGWFCISFTLGYLSNRINGEEQEPEENYDGEWILPIKLGHNGSTWYAWDTADAFILQADSREKLIQDILNEFEIPPKRLEIISESHVNELKSTTSV